MRTLCALALGATLLLAPTTAAAPGLPAANAYAGPAGTATMHGDSESSDTTPYAGPGAQPGLVVTVPRAAACPTILAGADRMPLTLCTKIVDRSPQVSLLDPATSLPVATLDLAAGSLLGGVYAYVDQRNRLVTVDGSGALLFIAHDQGGPGGGWRLFVQRRVPLAAAFVRACGAAACDSVATVAPGYDGRVWFATTHGRAGYVGRTGSVRLRLLARDETVANSISTSVSGTAVATDHALYQLRATRSGAIRILWRRGYDRGPARKPGQLSHGTGATPTYFGPRSGAEWVAITDDARPREHLLVFQVSTGHLRCRVPILSADNSGTENSPIGLRRQVYVASTYGYPYPALPEGAGPSDPATADFVGGMQRFDVTADGCRKVWTNAVRSAAVPRLSRAERVLYTVTRSTSDVWELARIDPGTGRLLTHQVIGLGAASDTLQMVGTIMPNGTLYQGTLTGYVAIKPRG